MEDDKGTPPEQQWEPLSPAEVKQLLGPLTVPWWVAGGYGLDLFIGHETRKHADVDVSVLRRDQQALREALGKWDVRIAHSGELIPWKKSETLGPEHHAVWARETPTGPWRLEVLFEESEGKRWAYRRNPRIGLNIADLGRRDASDIQFLRPEVNLLYKSKDPRPVDETDFLYALPRLDVAQKGWLVGALYTIDPTHRWIERLK